MSNSDNIGFRRRLLSERIHYRAPFCNVILMARIGGTIPAGLMQAALDKACARHPLLRARIEQDENGSAWFIPRENISIPVHAMNKLGDDDWTGIAADEQKIPFDLGKGPLIRFIMLASGASTDLLIICHHTICDGMSLVYLVRDIMEYLGDPAAELIPLPVPPVLDIGSMPEGRKTDTFPRLLLGRFNKAWRRNKKVFTEAGYREIHRNFWRDEELQISTQSISGEELTSLISRCKAKGVTVNSAVCAAFTMAQYAVQSSHSKFGKTGVAVNLRGRMLDAPGEGMGLFAGGSAVRLKNDSGRPFWDAAYDFDRKVKKLLKGGHKLQEILLFNLLDPALIDSIYFVLFGGYQNKTAESFARLAHFNKKGCSLGTTNLGRAGIPETYGSYSLETLYFVPSNIPGSDKILGVITFGGRMNLSLVTLKSETIACIAEEIVRKALAYLKQAVPALP